MAVRPSQGEHPGISGLNVTLNQGNGEGRAPGKGVSGGLEAGGWGEHPQCNGSLRGGAGPGLWEDAHSGHCRRKDNTGRQEQRQGQWRLLLSSRERVQWLRVGT